MGRKIPVFVKGGAPKNNTDTSHSISVFSYGENPTEFFCIDCLVPREIAKEETKRFHQSVIVTRLQWFTDTNIQMIIQKGLKPPSEKIKMPNWIDPLQTETISNNSAIMTRTITKKVAQLHLTIEDFLEGGQLAYYPNVEVTFLSDNMIKNLGISNLTTKESKTLLSHINKTMREMQKTIIPARRAQEDRFLVFNILPNSSSKKWKIHQSQPKIVFDFGREVRFNSRNNSAPPVHLRNQQKTCTS